MIIFRRHADVWLIMVAREVWPRMVYCRYRAAADAAPDNNVRCWRYA